MANPNDDIIRLTPEADGPKPTVTPIVRLPAEGARHRRDPRPLPVTDPPAAAEPDIPVLIGPEPERLTVTPRGPLSGRSQEPGVEQILDTSEQVEEMEDHWGDQATRHHAVPWGWFVLLGLALAGGAFWSTWQISQSDVHVAQVHEQALDELEKDERHTQQAEELVTRVERVVTAYCEAASVDELLPLVRQPERVKPLMEAWYRNHPFIQDPFRSMAEFLPQPLDNYHSFWGARIQHKSGKFHTLYLEEGSDGAVKIDWETAVGYQPMPWDDYARQRPAGDREFRVIARPDTFYSHEFADSDRWLCLRLEAPYSEEILYGYVERDRPLAQLLESHFRRLGGGSSQLILRLNASAGLNSPRGVRIESLRSIRWIYLHDPDRGA